MQYSPQPDNKRASLISWALIGAGAVLFCLPGAFPRGRAPLQAGAVLLIGAGIYFAIRFLMTNVTYELGIAQSADTEGAVPAVNVDLSYLPPEAIDFTVAKSVGRRPPVIDARFSLAELVWLAPLPAEGGREREPFKRYPNLRTWNYTVSLRPEQQYMAVFLDDANNASGLILELSPEMLSALTTLSRLNQN